MGILQQFDLTGKTALVTGCNKGIGKAMAIGLAEAGADIIGVSASLEPSGSDIEKEVKKLGKTFKPYQADFSERKSIYAFIDTLLNENLTIDILVNNAGTIMRAPAAEHSDEYWDRVIHINLDAQFILAREIGKHMLAKGHGKIIFIVIKANILYQFSYPGQVIGQFTVFYFITKKITQNSTEIFMTGK